MFRSSSQVFEFGPSIVGLGPTMQPGPCKFTGTCPGRDQIQSMLQEVPEKMEQGQFHRARVSKAEHWNRPYSIGPKLRRFTKQSKYISY